MWQHVCSRCAYRVKILTHQGHGSATVVSVRQRWYYTKSRPSAKFSVAWAKCLRLTVSVNNSYAHVQRRAKIRLSLNTPCGSQVSNIYIYIYKKKIICSGICMWMCPHGARSICTGYGGHAYLSQTRTDALCQQLAIGTNFSLFLCSGVSTSLEAVFLCIVRPQMTIVSKALYDISLLALPSVYESDRTRGILWPSVPTTRNRLCSSGIAHTLFIP